MLLIILRQVVNVVTMLVVSVVCALLCLLQGDDGLV
jgi:hypothetical protein